MKEIWKDIQGYEKLYKISNKGKIKSLLRKEKILKPCVNGRGYLVVSLSCNHKIKKYFLHRLIAQEFIPNPNNLPFINHINGNKKDNRITNLEWCTPQENVKHAYITKLTPGRIRTVNQYDLNENLLKSWKSQSLAAKELNIKQSSINHCCNNKRKSAGGFVWKYPQ